MLRSTLRRVCAGVTVCLLSFGAAARADESSAVDQIVSVLREKGLIDEATGNEILAKQAKAEAAESAKATPPVGQGVLDGFVFAGDLRLRYEQFWYNRAFGASADDNNRFRYRARFGFTKQVTPWALVGLRLASGFTDYRSTNSSAGEASDFSYDPIFIDRAYAQFAIPDPGIGLKTSFTGGKMANPFIWKNGLDKIVWDEDIAPEGGALTSAWSPTESSKVYATIAYFVELNNSTAADPRMWGYQGGGSFKVTDVFEVGARLSYYEWTHLANDATTATRTGFVDRSAANGNLPNAFDPDLHILESSGYLSFGGWEQWPVILWGTWIQNLAADGAVVSGARIGAEDQAFGVGVELGDVKKLLRLGVAYHYIEANAVSAQYTDSDLFDGRTNRRGWVVYGAREVATNTELRLTLWDAHPIKTTGSGFGDGPFNISGTTDSQANRRRLQADLNFKF